MKKRSILVTSLLGLALVACTDDDLSNSVDASLNEGALVSFKLDVARPETKGNPEKEPEQAGSEVESKIANATIVIDYADADTKIVTGTVDNSGTSPIVSFKAPTGDADFYVYVNPQSGDVADPWSTDLVSKATDPSAYFTDNSFFMSNVDGEPVHYTIQEGSNDIGTVNVERGAAKVTVESTAELEGAAGGKLTELKFALENTATKFHLLAQETIAEVTGNTYAAAPISVDDYATVELDESIYSSGTTIDASANLNALDACYCLENLHALTGYLKKNTTAVVFNASFIPGTVLTFSYADDKYTVTGDKEQTIAEDAQASTFYVVTEATNKSFEGNYIMASDIANATIGDADEDGICTVTGIDGISKVAEYTNGQCWFYAWPNYDEVNNASPIYRNDWYHLKVTKIVLPGSPTKPDLDEEEELEADVNLKATVTVQPWHFVSKDVTLTH